MMSEKRDTVLIRAATQPFETVYAGKHRSDSPPDNPLPLALRGKTWEEISRLGE